MTINFRRLSAMTSVFEMTPMSLPLGHDYSRHDIRRVGPYHLGLNGFCDPPILCNAGVGYDGPTGLGTPNGTAAF